MVFTAYALARLAPPFINDYIVRNAIVAMALL